MQCNAYHKGIPEVGEMTALALAKHYKTIEAFLNDKDYDILSLNGVGENVQKSIAHFKPEVHIKRILKHMDILPYQNSAGILSGKTIVFTGTLSHMSRAEAKERAKRMGAQIGSTVSQHTDIVIYGEAAGSKLKMAQQLGIKLLSEEEWMNLQKS